MSLVSYKFPRPIKRCIVLEPRATILPPVSLRPIALARDHKMEKSGHCAILVHRLCCNIGWTNHLSDGSTMRSTVEKQGVKATMIVLTFCETFSARSYHRFCDPHHQRLPHLHLHCRDGNIPDHILHLLFSRQTLAEVVYYGVVPYVYQCAAPSGIYKVEYRVASARIMPCVYVGLNPGHDLICRGMLMLFVRYLTSSSLIAALLAFSYAGDTEILPGYGVIYIEMAAPLLYLPSY